MREQYSSIVLGEEKFVVKNVEKQFFGIVIVLMGKGIVELFKSFGVMVVIEGG